MESRKVKSPNYESTQLTYMQPSRRRPLTYQKPYRKPKVKMESETTYGNSYMINDIRPFGRHVGIQPQFNSNTGSIDFNTIHSESYNWIHSKPAILIPQKAKLRCNGKHNMTTIYTMSYTDPGYTKIIRNKPYQEQLIKTVPMQSKTTMKESYQSFEPLTRTRSIYVPNAWQTSKTDRKFKTDYHTVNQLAYQPSKFTKVYPVKPFIENHITVPLKSDTTYTTSYQIPGQLVHM